MLPNPKDNNKKLNKAIKREDIEDVSWHLMQNEELYDEASEIQERLKRGGSDNLGVIKTRLECIGIQSTIRSNSINGSLKLKSIKADADKNTNDQLMFAGMAEFLKSSEFKSQKVHTKIGDKTSIELERELLSNEIANNDIPLSENDKRSLQSSLPEVEIGGEDDDE